MSSKEDEEVKNRVTELIRYCADGNLDIVRCYVDPNTVNCVDNEGRTPLYAAACSGNVELCSFLLSVSSNFFYLLYTKSTFFNPLSCSNIIDMQYMYII